MTDSSWHILLTVIDIETPFRRQFDGRLQVCFTPIPGADRYELGMEYMGSLMASDLDAEIVQDGELLCAVTSNSVSLGAYAEVWAVVTAYNGNSSALAAGEQTDIQLCE